MQLAMTLGLLWLLSRSRLPAAGPIDFRYSVPTPPTPEPELLLPLRFARPGRDVNWGTGRDAPNSVVGQFGDLRGPLRTTRTRQSPVQRGVHVTDHKTVPGGRPLLACQAH